MRVTRAIARYCHDVSAFRLLGPLEASDGDGFLALGGRRQRAVLAALLVAANTVVPDEALIAAVWGDDPPASALGTLHAYVSRLRRVLRSTAANGAANEAAHGGTPGRHGGTVELARRTPGYLLRVDPGQIDAVRFEQLARRGHRLLDEGDFAEAAAELGRALALWRGPALADLAGLAFARAEATRLEELRLAAVEDQVAAKLACGRHAELVGELERLVAAHPLRERLWAELMQALYHCGRQADALAAYQRARSSLLEELGLDPGATLVALERAILRHELPPPGSGPGSGERGSGAAGSAGAPAAAGPSHNLPLILDSFVGRERQVGVLDALLRRGPLVTVVGVGGVGKTRLAVETARRLLGRYPGGVWLVDLAPLSDPALVVEAVAAVLGVGERPGRALLDTVLDTLADGASSSAGAARPAPALLLLDNCEHLLDACAALAAAVAARCPGCHLLATSREPLGVRGEQLLQLPPLPLPTPGSDEQPEAASGEDLAAYPAVRLFLDRAHAARPGLHLNLEPAQLRTAVRVCRALDGLPLAIELAAARLTVLSLDELAARLADRFALLRGGPRTAPPRQRALRATMRWSYDLLGEAERALLRQLSVFAGGCTLEAVEAVCGLAPGVPSSPGSVLDALARLTAASLVSARDHHSAGVGAMRYGLLETVRRYGAERLAAAGEEAAARERHACYFLALAEGAAADLWTDRELDAYRRVEAERDNFRAALEWSFGGSDNRDTGPRLARALGEFWRIRGRLEEGKSWLRRALEALPEAEEALRADLLGILGTLHGRQNDLAKATPLLIQACTLSQRAGAERRVSRWLLHLGVLARDHGQYPAARRYLEASLRLRRAHGDHVGAAWVIGALGDLARAEGALDEAAALYEEGTAVAWRGGSQSQLCGYLDSTSRCAFDQGDLERSRALSTECLERARELGDVRHVALSLLQLGTLARLHGEPRRARQSVRDSLTHFWDLRDMGFVAEALEVLAGTAADEGRPLEAARLLGSAASIRQRHRNPLSPAARAALDRDLAALRERLGAAAVDAAMTAGAALDPSQAVAEALQASASVEA